MVDSTLQGYWWLPGGALDEDSVAGSLQISSRKLPVLTLMGTLDDDPTLLLGKAEHVIIGVTESGRNVSLLRAHGSVGMRQREANIYSERWVGEAALVGKHVIQPEDAHFRHADLELDVLTDLVESGMDRARVSEESIEWSWRRPTTANAEWNDVSLQIEAAPHGGLVDEFTHELRFWSVPRFRISWQEPVDLGTILMRAAYPLVDLCSLFAGRPANIERIALHSSDTLPRSRFAPDEVQLHTNRSRRSDNDERSGNRISTFHASALPLSKLVPRWLDLWHTRDLQHLLEAFFSQDGRPSAFNETTFLGHVFFLEGLHRALEQSGNVDFADRLRDLLIRIEIVVDETATDPEELVRIVKTLRNAFAHGTELEDYPILRGRGLGVLNKLLDLMIRATLLDRLGFSDDQVRDMLHIETISARNRGANMPWSLDSDLIP